MLQALKQSVWTEWLGCAAELQLRAHKDPQTAEYAAHNIEQVWKEI